MKCYPTPIGCGREFTWDEFLQWDRLSQKEFWISGLCLDPCQNAYFTDAEEEDGWTGNFDGEVPCNCQGLAHRNDCPNWVLPF